MDIERDTKQRHSENSEDKRGRDSETETETQRDGETLTQRNRTETLREFWRQEGQRQ